MSDKVMVDAGELARLQQIGRLAAHALDAYVSTLHVQECTIRNPGIALVKGDERRTVEQLAADLRAAAALAPAPAPAASSGAEAGEVYLLEDDMGDVLSIHPSEDAAQKTAQAMMDRDARRNRMPRLDIVWTRKRANKKQGAPARLLGDTGLEGFFNFVVYPMPLAPAPAGAE